MTHASMLRKVQRIVYTALCVGGNLIVGNIEAIDDMIAALKEKGLVLKIMEGLQDYLSCEIKFLTDKKRVWLGQPHLEEIFGECIHRIFAVVKLQVCLNF